MCGFAKETAQCPGNRGRFSESVPARYAFRMTRPKQVQANPFTDNFR
jgi:hypothetical protein